MNKENLLFRYLLAIILLLSIFHTSSYAVVEFFVSPSGNDANPGIRERLFVSLEHVRQVVANRRDITTRNFLGVSVRNIIGQGEISAYGLADEMGVLVLQVTVGSAADKAGLREGDVILTYKNLEISSINSLFNNLNDTAKGTKVKLDIWRLNSIYIYI